MLGLIDTKVYLAVGLITAALLFAIDFFDKNEAVVGFLRDQATRAQGSGLGTAVANFIVRPLIFAVDGPVGAVLGGLLWPVLLLWLLLLVVLLAFGFLAPGIFRANCSFNASC